MIMIIVTRIYYSYACFPPTVIGHDGRICATVVCVCVCVCVKKEKKTTRAVNARTYARAVLCYGRRTLRSIFASFRSS